MCFVRLAVCIGEKSLISSYRGHHWVCMLLVPYCSVVGRSPLSVPIEDTTGYVCCLSHIAERSPLSVPIEDTTGYVCY